MCRRARPGGGTYDRAVSEPAPPERSTFDPGLPERSGSDLAPPERSKALGCAVRWLLTCVLLVWAGSAARMFALMAVFTAGPFVLLGLVGAIPGLVGGLVAAHLAVRTGKAPARSLGVVLLLGLLAPAGAFLPWERWGIERAIGVAGGGEAIVAAGEEMLAAAPGSQVPRPLRALQPRAVRTAEHHVVVEVYGVGGFSGFVVPRRGWRATVGREVAPGVWWVTLEESGGLAVVPR